MGVDLALGRTAGADEIAGLDALETQRIQGPPLLRRIWVSAWPKVLALAIFLGLWELVVLSGWKPTYVLPGPADVFGELWAELQKPALWGAIGITLRRAVVGFGIALLIGLAIGSLVAR